MNRIDSNELDRMADWMLNREKKPFNIEPGDTLTFTFNASEHKMSETGQGPPGPPGAGGLDRNIGNPGRAHGPLRELRYPVSQDLRNGAGLARGARIDIDTDHVAKSNGNTNSSAFQTFLHEIGHALGLGHPGPYGRKGDSRFIFDIDSYQATVMSYQPQSWNPNIDASRANACTPQIADIIAIQTLYGKPPKADNPTDPSHNTTYIDTDNYNPNLIEYNNQNKALLYNGKHIATLPDNRTRTPTTPAHPGQCRCCGAPPACVA